MQESVMQETMMQETLASAQRFIWYHQLINPNCPAYNVAQFIRIKGPIDITAMNQAHNCIVRGTEIFRLRFGNEQGQPFQRVIPAKDLELELWDMREAKDPVSEAYTLLNQLELEHIDLENGPQCRFGMIRLAEQDWLYYSLFHHLIIDAAGAAYFTEALAECYRTRATTFNDRNISWFAAVAQDSAYQASDTWNEDKAFWKEKLAGVPSPATLSTKPFKRLDLSRPLSVSMDMPRSLYTDITQWGVNTSRSAYATFATAVILYLSKLTGKTDICVGTPTAGRVKNTRTLIGMLANAVPLRIPVEANETVSDLTKRIARETRVGLRHNRFPYGEIAAMHRQMNLDPPFSFLINHLVFNQQVDFGDATGLVETRGAGAITDLELQIFDRSDNGPVQIRLDYNGDRYSEEQAREHLTRLYHLLLRLPSLSETPIASFGVLDIEEQTRIIEKSSGASLRLDPAIEHLPALFEAQVAKHPELAALLYEDQGRPTALTYSELDERANQLARYLIRQGVGTEQTVSILLRRSPELIVSMLAILKTGAAYLPLDPDYPAARLQYLIEDSNSQHLISISEHLQSPEIEKVLGQQKRIDLEDFAVSLNIQTLDASTITDTQRIRPLLPDNLAYIIYTSGSTGNPKPVGVPHRGVLNMAHAKDQYLNIHSGDRVLQFASHAFDGSVQEIWSAFAAGATLVLPANAMRMNSAANIAEHLAKFEVTHATLPPALVKLLDESALAPLKTLCVAGEVCPPELVERFAANRRMVNAYGPTEVTVCAAMSPPLQPRLALTLEEPVSIGKQIHNVDDYILDDSLELVPDETIGELYVAGVGVTRGYLSRPGLTAERFIACPFGTPGRRMYRTGDLVMRKKNGLMVYVGRADTQVKIRGFRIELGEIEKTILAKFETISHVAVVAKDFSGELRLVAYLISQKGVEQPDQSRLRAELSAALPEYMVPAYFHYLEAFPLTVHGKLDVRALPEPGTQTDQHSYQAPRNPLETVICGLFESLTGTSRVGIDDDFFTIGGHSLLAISLVTQLREQLGCDITLDKIFEYPTPQALALQIVSLEHASQLTQSELKPGMGQLADGRIALSLGQKRFWTLGQLDHAKSAYNLPFAVRLQGSVRVEALKLALISLLERHQPLRTLMKQAGDGEIYGVLHPIDSTINILQIFTPESFLKHTGREVSTCDRSIVDAFITYANNLAFDLERDLSIRAMLLEISPTDSVLVITLHHQAGDGLSSVQLFDELGKAYQAYALGQAPEWAPLNVEYSDWAVWHTAKIENRIQEKIERAKARLADAPEYLSLPLDFPRDNSREKRAGYVRQQVESKIVQGLEKFARIEQTTLFTAILAGYATLLSRLSRQQSVVIGSPVGGRTTREAESLVGYFVNTIVTPVTIGHETSGSDLLRQTHQQLTAALSDQDMPFERLVEELNIPRSLGQTPIFQAMLAYQTDRPLALDLPGLQCAIQPVTLAHAKFDLTLYLTPLESGAMECVFEYDADLFEQDSVQRWADAFVQLLDALQDTPEQPIAQLSWMTEDQVQETIKNSSGLLCERSPEPLTLVERFEAQVKRTPEGCALMFEITDNDSVALNDHLIDTVTYRQLDERSNQFARHLLAQGIRGDDVVAILLERGPDTIIAMLGALKAGAAYLPLDPEVPIERLSFMVDDSKTRALVTTTKQQQRFESKVLTATVLVIDDPSVDAVIRSRHHSSIREEERASPLLPEQLAYLIYTSGSTGTPKGAGNTHRAIVNHMDWIQSEMRLRPNDRVLQKTAIGFDVAVWEWFAPLMTGATLVIARPGGHKDAAYLHQAIDAYSITMIHFVASMLELFLEEKHALKHESLRLIVTSGEALSGTLQSKTLQAFPQIEFWDLYGPTEAAIHVSAWRCRLEDGLTPPPIGLPIWNTHLFILDPSLEPVPEGVVGELYIAGEGLARGYLGRAALTAERFIACPWLSPGARMYRSGDLARRRKDGAIEYLGRADDQVKIRGFRIELGEIEAALLMTSPEISQAAVIATSNGSETRLAAYLVGHQQQTIPSANVLRTRLNGRLPDYMVPTYLIVLDALPLNANGKLDRRALPAPDLTTELNDYVEPSTPTESLLCRLFSEVTGLDTVSVDASFFAIGGQSLSAMRLVARLRKELGVTLPLRVLFEHTTPQALAPHIDILTNESDTPLRAGSGLGTNGTVTLSFGQRRLGTLDRIDGPSSAYNMSVLMTLSAAPSIEALGQALVSVIERHQPLRTVMKEDNDGLLYGLVLPLPRPSDLLTVENISENEAYSIHADSIRSKFEREAARPFKLDQDYSLRALLLIDHSDNAQLLISVHHQAADAASVGILARELNEAYVSHLAGHAPQWDTLPVAYADWAAWQQSNFQTGTKVRIDQIKQRLADFPECLTLPLDRQRQTNSSRPARHVPIRIQSEVIDKLRILAAEHDTTMFAVLLAIYAATLSRISGQNDIVVGSPVAGRQHIETEGLIGFLLNTLAIPIHAPGLMTGAELIEHTKNSVNTALSDQDIPFEKLIEELGVTRSLHHSPLFQAMFAYQADTAEPFALGSLVTQHEILGSAAAKYDLTLHLRPEANGTISGSFEYDCDLFNVQSIQRWARAFESLTHALANRPDEPIQTFTLMDTATCQNTLASGRGISVILDESELTLPDVFEKQVLLTPQAIAIEWQHQQISYQDLNNRVNQLSHYLIHCGIRCDDVVAMMLDRTPDLIIALLAINKAGAAYLPLDVDYPESRLAFMLSDSRANIVLSHTCHQELIDRIISKHGLSTRVLSLDQKNIIDDVTKQPKRDVTNLDRSSPLTPDHLVYLMYTSGSTGNPKGVGFLHRSLMNLVKWQHATIPSQAQRVLQYSPISFDASAQEIAWAYSKGATLVLVDNETRRDSRLLAQYIQDHHVDHLYAPFVVLNNLADAKHTFEIDGWPEAVFTAGEQLQITPAIRAAYQSHPTARLHNLYGPTEAHVVSYYTMDEDLTKWEEFPPIGYPIWNNDLYILDSTLEPLPDGVLGELYLAGTGLARGYFNRPGLTAQKFIANPFGEPGARMYRTGDIALRLPSGAIQFLGRADDQVKIRGFRIELGEVESTLLSECPTLSKVAVIARQVGQASADKRLVAYLVAQPGQILPDTAQLRNTLLKKLPDYMVPAYFVTLDSLPLSPAGKLDRRALPDPIALAKGDSIEKICIPPNTESERLLVRLFMEITESTEISADDSFFAIGGHSLLAMKLVARVRQVTEKTLPLRAIFEHPTPQQLAVYLDGISKQSRRRIQSGMGRIRNDN
ncbi:non-ribosomal peptide synthetase [Zwartia vadi]|uniref:non-ribosomal peptide synthetase n=1 Tax=Zwartia vadi TaxID=3058168 RepID=UPI0025B3D767|nr:non-ribosomal peptide synthetase [Zwartia vadi]MDN3988603.1 amino acid adenylation domain-containing protein [Zwartia vadi]